MDAQLSFASLDFAGKKKRILSLCKAGTRVPICNSMALAAASSRLRATLVTAHLVCNPPKHGYFAHMRF